jgi:multidrug transporter EmrE-like cation transporter
VVCGAVFALCVGWVLYLRKGNFVPIVFSVLVVYGIAGLAQLLWLR